jgi:Nuclease-related domain
VFLARVTGDPQTATAWKKGADGEARAGSRLTELLEGSGVRLLHDRRMPGSRSANIDHIAIGPGGITVIDTKNNHGKVRVQRVGGLFSERRDTLTIAGRDKIKHIDGVERQMAAVVSLLPQPDGDAIDIRGALCFADVDGLPLLRHLSARNVIVDGPRSTAKLASRPGPLTPEQVDTLWVHLGTTLPAA